MRIRRCAAALALLGLLLGGPLARAPAARAAEACFAETGHCVRGAFLDYWLAHGGLAVIGYPLTEEFALRLEDGSTHAVQYFERARLEAHPENAPPFDVLLGQFGRRILTANNLLATDPGFKALYLGYWPVPLRLGDPLAPA